MAHTLDPSISYGLSNITGIQFGLLSEDDILGISAISNYPKGIESPDTYDNNKPKKNGLLDTRMGVVSHEYECKTCGLDMNSCPGHFAHTELALPVMNIGVIKWTKKILGCICLECKKLLIDNKSVKTGDLERISKIPIRKVRFAQIRKLCKNVSICSRTNYGCGAPIPKIKIEGGFIIVAEYKYVDDDETAVQNGADTSVDYKKNKIKRVLTPNDLYEIFKKIDDSDYELMGFNSKYSRPESMIFRYFPISPPAVRPSVKLDNQPMEDDLTSTLQSVIKTNNRLFKFLEENNIENLNVMNSTGKQLHQLLQTHVSNLIDNEASGVQQGQQRTGKPIKSISSRLKGKEGRLRGNLSGKRVNFSARTVITADPTLEVFELGVPKKIAMNIPYPEIATPENIEYLQTLVNAGKFKYPGANFIIPKSYVNQNVNKGLVDLRYNRNYTVQIGDMVERHLQTGDWVLFNRQPSLHRMSMMGHRVKVLPYSTFRLNLSATKPYNADFDGDEMNMHAPLSLVTKYELMNIACLPNQIISPATSRPIIGLVQDSLIGSYLLTRDDTVLSRNQVMNLMAYIDDYKFVELNKETYTGKEVFSMILKDDIHRFKKMGDKVKLKIENGKLLEGVMDKSSLSNGTHDSIVQEIWRDDGKFDAAVFLHKCQLIADRFLVENGFSI